jgi:ABC-type multidrug transport system fused ATPase/permease subunit
MEVLNNLSSNITLLIVAHRLSTLAACNKIYQIHHGKLLYLGSAVDEIDKYSLINAEVKTNS